MDTVYPPPFIDITLHSGYWEQTSYIPTYIWLTMASYENSKLTGALTNAPQKIYPLDFPGFDTPLTLKDTKLVW